MTVFLRQPQGDASHYFGHLGITPRGRLSVTGVDTVEDLNSQPDALRRAYALGEQLKAAFGKCGE